MSIFESTKNQQDWALAVLRVTVGAVFVAHGAQKLFTYGIAGTTGAFGQMGIPFSGIAAPLIALLEFFGGLALMAGFLKRFVSLAMVLDMVGAIAFVHFNAGFFMPKGYEFALILLVASVGLTIAGSGAVSIDSLIANRRRLQSVRNR